MLTCLISFTIEQSSANIVSSRQRGAGFLGWFGAFSKFIFCRKVLCPEIPLRLKLVLGHIELEDNFESATMDKKIIVYGYGDKTEHGLPTEKDLIQYLRRWIFTDNDRRHRYTQAKKADIIVVSRDGFAYGHMIIEKLVNPTSEDIKDYPKVKKVYIVNSTTVYKNRVKLNDLGIHVRTFGTTITLKQFEEITSKASETKKYFPSSGGSGFGSNKQNKKVEVAAITFVKKWYHDHGWTVNSVENERCGYDLDCRKESRQENVEVKGVSGRFPSFIITAGEVTQARKNPNFVLSVVTEALSKEKKIIRYTGDEFLTKFICEPLQFRAELRE